MLIIKSKNDLDGQWSNLEMEFDRRTDRARACTVNQTGHPSGVGEMVAIIMQWVITTEDCEV
jgi:hypothetical protein